VIQTGVRNDFFDKSGHFGFERLELQHEEFDAGCVKFMDAAGDGIAGTDETWPFRYWSRCAATCA
jgi:hypothetical protein